MKMLMDIKIRHSALFRVLTTSILCLFLYSDIAFALGPRLLLNQEKFQEEYLLKSFLLSHQAVNKYITQQINPENKDETDITKLDSYRSDKIYIKTGKSEYEQEIGIIAIQGLLKNTGQLAHIGLGRQNGRPIIYVDSRYFYNETVIGHEKDEITKWEKLRRLKTLNYQEMRAWIVKYIDRRDPVEKKTSRQVAEEIHASSRNLGKIYDEIRQRYKNFVRDSKKETAEALLDLAKMYELYQGARYVLDKDNSDINLAAHEAGGVSKRQQPAASWIDENVPELKGKTIFSLSMEGGSPTSEGYKARNASVKGGLGAYFIDKLEGMAAIGINAFGAQIGYAYIRKDGRKIRVNYEKLVEKGALQKVLTGSDAIMVRAWDEDPDARCDDDEDPRNPKVAVEVYKSYRGGATDYVFMSKIFDELYPDDRTRRFTQEIVFGKAVYEFMKRTNFVPDILHLNEAHTVVAAAQMRADDEEYNKTAIIYTNHTIVPAGLEIFSPDRVRSDVDRMMYVIGLPGKCADRFRSIFLRPDGVVDFCHAAVKLSDVITAVSREHALKTKKLFQGMYGEAFNVEVVGILNGSGQAWKTGRLLELESSGRIFDSNDAWAIHEAGKAEAFAKVEERTGVKLDLNKPTAWAIRRLVDYKSQYPMLKFIVHLITADRARSFTRDELRQIWFRDLTNFKEDYESNYMGTREIAESVLNRLFPAGVKEVHGLGMQVVVGWPQPAYQEFWACEFNRWTNLSDLKGRFAAVPSDIDMLKMQAVGADICLTMPRPLEEACGTSDQRTALNFGVNIAIKGAGPVEWMEEYDEANESGSGFFIGSYTRQEGDDLVADNEKFYKEAPIDIFEKAAICSRLFYDEGKSKWKRLMLNSYLRANEIVTAVAMEKRYALGAYLPAIRKRIPLDKKTDIVPIKELDNKIEVNTGTGRIRFAGTSPVSEPWFEFWAVRHGETDANKESRFQGAIDERINQLNEEGIGQAKDAAEELFENLKDKIQHGEVVVLTSQSGRTKATADYFLKTVEARLGISITPVEEPLLNEISFTVWENKTEKELGQDQLELVERYRRGLDATVRAEGGESFIDLLIRSKLLIDKLNREYKNKNLVIFGSGTQIRATKVVLGDRSMLDDKGYIDWRSKEQAVPNARPIRLFAFPDIMADPDKDYTKTLANAVIGEMARRPIITSAMETVRMAVLHQINIESLMPEDKVLWHIIEEDVIPKEQQQGSFITQINKAFRGNKDAAEKIWILDGKKTIEEAIADIRKDEPGAVIDIALSSESHIESVPNNKEIKMLVFKAEGFIQLEGVVAALRALHSDNVLQALLRIYSVMAGKPFNSPPDAISDDPKEFARRLIFNLPRASSVPIDDIPRLNERLLQLLTAA